MNPSTRFLTQYHTIPPGTFTKQAKQYQCTQCDAGKVCDADSIADCKLVGQNFHFL